MSLVSSLLEASSIKCQNGIVSICPSQDYSTLIPNYLSRTRIGVPTKEYVASGSRGIPIAKPCVARILPSPSEFSSFPEATDRGNRRARTRNGVVALSSPDLLLSSGTSSSIASPKAEDLIAGISPMYAAEALEKIYNLESLIRTVPKVKRGRPRKPTGTPQTLEIEDTLSHGYNTSGGIHGVGTKESKGSFPVDEGSEIHFPIENTLTSQVSDKSDDEQCDGHMLPSRNSFGDKVLVKVTGSRKMRKKLARSSMSASKIREAKKSHNLLGHLEQCLTNEDRQLGIQFDEGELEELFKNYQDISSAIVSRKASMPLSSEAQTKLGMIMRAFKRLESLRTLFFTKFNRYPTTTELAEKRKVPVAALITQLKLFRAARNKLVKHNLGLLYFIIGKMAKKYPRITPSELTSWGLQAILTAAINYDPYRCCGFTFYAGTCIRHKLKKELCNIAYLDQIPITAFETIEKLGKIRQDMSISLGRNPTLIELSQKTGITVVRLIEYLRPLQPIYYLESMGPTFNYPATEFDPEDSQLLKNEVDSMLSILTQKEKKIIIQRFGLDGSPSKTLAEIGKIMNCTKQNVQLSHHNALRKIRSVTPSPLVSGSF